MVLGLKLALLPAARKCHLKPELPLCWLFAGKRKRWSPFLLVFTGYGYKKNIFKGEKKFWLVEVVFFL